jgi:hypothetical protein
MGPFIHRQREQPADLVDQRSLAFFLQGGQLSPPPLVFFFMGIVSLRRGACDASSPPQLYAAKASSITLMRVRWL